MKATTTTFKDFSLLRPGIESPAYEADALTTMPPRWLNLITIIFLHPEQLRILRIAICFDSGQPAQTSQADRGFMILETFCMKNPFLEAMAHFPSLETA